MGSDTGNVYYYDSSGSFTQRQMLTNFNTRFRSNIMLFGIYAFGHAEWRHRRIRHLPRQYV